MSSWSTCAPPRSRRSPRRALRTTEKEYELDAIVFATGFDAMTGALREIDIRTSDGAVLADHWEGGPLTYPRPDGLGLSQHVRRHRPPASPGVKTQMIASIEQHVDWIADALDHLGKHQLDRIEPSPHAEAEWVGHVNAVADSTLYPLANSWYVGREHSWQAARVHALCRRLRPLQEALRRDHCQRLRRLYPQPSRSLGRGAPPSSTTASRPRHAGGRPWPTGSRPTVPGESAKPAASSMAPGAARSAGRATRCRRSGVWPHGTTAAARAERALLASADDVRALTSRQS